MWPFKKQTPLSEHISHSQVDITERFSDNVGLTTEDWIATVSLNATTPDPKSMGLPPDGTSAEDVYEIASRLSRLRESVAPSSDGVYCPICHIANVELSKLHTACPKCGRALLQFGWD